ncbi:hypothetical protein [Microbacterium sp.]|uniref:hypothetical protein n=1 Tax=Microbacterium sp. TaxID=51671 RepID=UPI003A855A34
MAVTETPAPRDAKAGTRPPVWIAGTAIALVIAVIALVAVWGIALPVTPPGGVCAAILPPSAGCAGDARLLPATVWSLLIAGAVFATLLLGRRRWWGALAGIALTAIIGFAGYLATSHIRLFLFA